MMEMTPEQLDEITKKIFWMSQWELRRQEAMDKLEKNARDHFEWAFSRNPMWGVSKISTVEERLELERQIAQAKTKIAEEFERYKPYDWEVPEPLRKAFGFHKKSSEKL